MSLSRKVGGDMGDGKIDVVILWVDGGDASWVKLKNKYLGNNLSDRDIKNLSGQYRDWDNLQYIFRGIETFMPWVDKVHFVTNGQKPSWLNEKAPKLNWVKHEDFMHKDYLPTFSANPIELNLHRIQELSERFIYFNDDMFITKPARINDFFPTEDTVRDQSVLFRITSVDYGDVFGHLQLNDIGIINHHFNRNEVLKKHFTKFFSPRNGFLAPLLSATFLPTNHFPGFMVNHMPQPYFKSTFEEVWAHEGEVLHKVSLNKFRTIGDVNQYVMREWQFVTGRFQPYNLRKVSRYFSIFPQDLEAACSAIESGKYRMICINDAVVDDFEYTKAALNSSFQKILPLKSSFEK